MIDLDNLCFEIYEHLDPLNGENIIGLETCVFASPECLAFRLPGFSEMFLCLQRRQNDGKLITLYVAETNTPSDEELKIDWQVTTDKLWYGIGVTAHSLMATNWASPSGFEREKMKPLGDISLEFEGDYGNANSAQQQALSALLGIEGIIGAWLKRVVVEKF